MQYSIALQSNALGTYMEITDAKYEFPKMHYVGFSPANLVTDIKVANICKLKHGIKLDVPLLNQMT